MGRVIGKQGLNINTIREKSGARIEAEDRSDELCEFRISGRTDSIERAKHMIQELLEKVQQGGGVGGCSGGLISDRGDGRGLGDSDTLEFPVALTGGIIGSRGAKINEVRQQSGARVQVEKLEDICRVVISGGPEQIDKAKAMIRALADEGQSVQGALDRSGASGDSGGAVTDFLEYPLSLAGGLIGARGAHVNDVRQRSGARVQIEKLEDRCRVQLAGTAQQVERAKELVKILAEEQGGPRRADAEELLEVPKAMVGRVIGKGGETIQRLQKDSGARLDVDARDASPCCVRISGSRECVQRARYMINEVLERSDGLYPGADGGAWGGAHGYGSHPGSFGPCAAVAPWDAMGHWPPAPHGWGHGGYLQGGAWAYPGAEHAGGSDVGGSAAFGGCSGCGVPDAPVQGRGTIDLDEL